MIEGRCLCGTVRFEVEAVRDMVHCHCSICRKHHGAAFATMARVREDAFRWTAGEETIRRYESSPGFHRCFCGTCGASLPGRSPAGGRFVPAGLFVEDPGKRPNAHIFAASKAPWHGIADDLLRFDGWPPDKGLPDKGLPEIERDRPAGAEGIGGSCVCGGIVWEVREAFGRVHNCHCSRCRRARAAAHATNGFTSAHGVRFLRGEDLAVEWEIAGSSVLRGAVLPRLRVRRSPVRPGAGHRRRPDGGAGRRSRARCGPPHLHRLDGPLVCDCGRPAAMLRGGARPDPASPAFATEVKHPKSPAISPRTGSASPMDMPLMPKATAVWLIDNTRLTFEQIGAFCALHMLEVQALADGDIGDGHQRARPDCA